jgi:hypothetical protein
MVLNTVITHPQGPLIGRRELRKSLWSEVFVKVNIT